MRRVFVSTLLLLPAAAHTQDAPMHHHHEATESTPSPGDAPLKITINPEARVSVAMWGSLPPPVPCGTAISLPIKIVNHGFVTSRLEAQLVGEPPSGAILDFHPDALSGIREETRIIRITLTKPGTTDLTIAFKSHNEVPDLGGRDRVHFLLTCRY